jgi:aspartate racemase
MNVVLPNRAGRAYVHNVIYNELCAGKLIPESKQRMMTIMLDLQQKGAQAVVLGCTELPLLISAQDTSLRLFDTMALHTEKAVTLALAG